MKAVIIFSAGVCATSKKKKTLSGNYKERKKNSFPMIIHAKHKSASIFQTSLTGGKPNCLNFHKWENILFPCRKKKKEICHIWLQQGKLMIYFLSKHVLKAPGEKLSSYKITNEYF